jgi:glycosyltransferase involved in cell wall biosynthesis
LHPKKGLDVLLQAFQRVRTRVPESVLMLIGTGDPAYVAGLQKLAANLGVGADVRFPGFLSGELKWGALSAADIFVLPSNSESFGIAPIEAMAAGTPVIVSDQAAVSKEVRRCSSGIVVPCDVPATASAIEMLLLDRDARLRMSEQARASVRRFSPIQVAVETRHLYERILGGVKDSAAIDNRWRSRRTTETTAS